MIHLLVFRMSGADFAIALRRVREIATPRSAERSGVPLVDLARHFGLRPSPPRPRACVVVELDGGELAGFDVDSVSGVVTVSPAEIADPPRFAPSYLTGVAQVEGRLLLVLDAGRAIPAPAMAAAG